MKIRYPGPHVKVEIAATGETVAAGDTVDVDGDLAKRLIAQGWVKVSAAKGGDDE